MAINTSRAQRRTDEHVGKIQTSDTVGPGTYSNTHNELAKQKTESAVPFWSLQEKVLNANQETSALTPGPGAYGAKPIKTSRDGIGVGHIPFRSKMSRMAPTTPGSGFVASTREKNPGPGTYQPESEIGTQLDKELVKAVKPVLQAKDKTTPSIPIRRLLPGSQPEGAVDSDAEMTALVMRHTGEPRDMVGPGEYEPGGRLLVGATAPQTTFYSSKLNRDLFEPSVRISNGFAPRENPGPGFYDPNPDIDVGAKKADSDADIATYQFASRTPMSHQIKIPEERVIPGPGRYENPGHIDKRAEKSKEQSTHLGDRTQFGSNSVRCGWHRDPDHPFVDPFHMKYVPGPGHYSAAGSSLKEEIRQKQIEKIMPNSHKKKINGVHHPNIIMALQETTGPLQAFNSTDDRPCNKRLEQGTPAPSEYSVEEARAKSMSSDLKERAKVGRKGAFGTCANRFYGSPLDGKAGLPDPGIDYPEEKNGAYVEPRSVFQSATPRFNDGDGHKAEVHAARNAKLLQTPAPGQYETQAEPNYRSPFRTPRTEHVSFGSCHQRYGNSANQDLFSGHTPSLKNPGPGEYAYWNDHIKRSRVKGGADLKADRPRAHVGCTTEQVGPGSYGQSTDMMMLKKTFNVTTQAPASGTMNSARGLAKGSARS